MDEEDQRLVLEMLDDQLPRISAFGVTWFGGEPLVGKKALFALSKAFIDRCERANVNYDARITTNGYLLDEETCIQLRDHRVKNAQITLDGPPELHNQMRPLINGKGSFWKIVENLRHAINYLRVSIRISVDTRNFDRIEELMQILANEGFAGKLWVYVGQLWLKPDQSDNAPASSGRYNHRCFNCREFAEAEQQFDRLAQRYGFSVTQPQLPRPVHTWCTALRANELVVGSRGELYKCWDSVGNNHEVIGHVRDYKNPNARHQKWLMYDPFADFECRNCKALPVCMGGCAHHAFDRLLYENRCSTFRHLYRERVIEFVEAAEKNKPMHTG